MAELNFDAREIEDAQFEPIPAGKYEAVITASEWRRTKAGTGEYLLLEFQLTAGYPGRFLWTRLNLKNQNPDAVKIARQELAAICKAVQVLSPKDSVELHNLPLIVGVRCKKREDTGDMTNEIHGYYPRACTAAPPVQDDSIPW